MTLDFISSIGACIMTTNMEDDAPKAFMIVSDETTPSVSVTAEPGKKFQVTTISLVDTSFQEVSDEVANQAIAARLCGLRRGRCVAIVEVD
jgi:hypothetical protein